MNEACSAGTGSFIEEQGRKLGSIDDVSRAGAEALAASEGVSLGQHCSVFMAEIIDEAVGAGVDRPAIVAGIYDSIVQNYLNRVKGSRSVGEVIFCQGMPFSSDALAAAVARQTGSEVVVPPDPGTVGALGIALLARAPSAPPGPSISAASSAPASRARTPSSARPPRAAAGPATGGRIDRLTTRVDRRVAAFTWGGGCSLYDKGTRRRKLPDLAPDPFARPGADQAIVERLSGRAAAGASP